MDFLLEGSCLIRIAVTPQATCQEVRPLKCNVVYSTFHATSQRTICCASQHYSPQKRNIVLARILPLILLLGVVPLPARAQSAPEDNLSVNARFLVAARSGDAATLERTLAQGAAVNSRNRLGESALIILLKNNKVDLAQKVLAAGADVNQPALNGITPLMTAAFNGQAAMAGQLLDKGANVAALDRLQKNAMIYAAGAGHTDIVLMLLAKGVDPNAVYANDLTALMWAAGFGKTATVKALLGAGANPKLRDNRGKTAADMARAEHFDETAAMLDSAK
jgi:ankyrin repeat protein